MRPTIDLAAALAVCDQHQAAPLTLRALVLAFNTRHLGDHDWRLRKWMEAFGHASHIATPRATCTRTRNQLQVFAVARPRVGHRWSTMALRSAAACSLTPAC